jgi:exodeoxyribonuclease VIII
MEPGIYDYIPNAQYHAGPGISQSALSVMARSPLHYWSKYLDPNREPTEPTPAMKLGTAIHTAVLEPDLFEKQYIIAPDVDRRTKEGKAVWQQAVEQADAIGGALISYDDAMLCGRIAQQVREHPMARKVFATGQVERSVYWNDRETGLLCRARPDLMNLPLLVDLKSTDDASPAGFQKSAWNFRYWMQAAWYIDGIEQATGIKPDAFIFAAFEKTAPFACAFYYADEPMLEMGRREYRKLLRLLADCIATDTWPGYPAEVRALGVPSWAITAAERAAEGQV